MWPRAPLLPWGFGGGRALRCLRSHPDHPGSFLLGFRVGLSSFFCAQLGAGPGPRLGRPAGRPRAAQIMHICGLHRDHYLRYLRYLHYFVLFALVALIWFIYRYLRYFLLSKLECAPRVGVPLRGAGGRTGRAPSTSTCCVAPSLQRKAFGPS